MKLLVVIHESIVNLETLLLYHQSPTYKASYHVVIARNGHVIHLVPANRKAYAAANSQYKNNQGIIEQINGSVDDFAYHIVLESPPEGLDETLCKHSGYTQSQYKSLGWLISQTGVDIDRVVTHEEVKLTKSEVKEPRSFNKSALLNLIKKNEKVKIDFGILK